MSQERTILIVDDSAAMRQLLRFAVKRVTPCRCIEANDGEEALAHLSTEKIDVVLADINMPIMDGFTLLGRIRGREDLKSVPVVMITTEGETAERERAMSLGATAYLTKPVQAPAVASVLRQVLGL